MTVTVLCPFCGRETIQPDARFCDGCGNDLSLFWKTLAPLVRQLSQQQASLDEQSRTALALKERIQALDTKLSASVSRSEIDATTTKTQENITRLTARVHELEAKLTGTVPRTALNAKESELENLRRERNKQSERVQALEAKLAKSVQSTELEARQSETENLRKELTKLRNDKAQSEASITMLTGRVRELEAKLADTVPRAEFEARESENETLRNELSKLRDGKADSEANIARLTKRLSELEGRLAETVPRSKFESNESETKTLQAELSKLRDEKAQSETSIAHLTGRVNELEAKHSETKNLQGELSKPRDAKPQPEAGIEELSDELANAVQTRWRAKPVQLETHLLFHGKKTFSSARDFLKNRLESSSRTALRLIRSKGGQVNSYLKDVFRRELESIANRSQTPTAERTKTLGLATGVQTARSSASSPLSLMAPESHDKAIECFDRAIQIDPKDPGPWYEKGSALLASEKYAEAVLCFDRAIQIDPNYVPIGETKGWYERSTPGLNRLIISKAVLDSGAITGAIKEQYESQKNSVADPGSWADFLLTRDPQLMVKRWYITGLDFLESDKYAEAVQCFDKVIQTDPNHKDGWYYKGFALRCSESKPSESIECFDRVIQLDPGYVDAWVDKGIVLASQEKNADAMRCLERAIQIDLNCADAWYIKGRVLSVSEKTAEAIRCFDKVIEIDPDHVKAWYYKGRLLCLLDNYAEAKKCFDRVIQIEPNFTAEDLGEGWYDKSWLDKLTKLKEHLDSGAITKEEFEREKQNATPKVEVLSTPITGTDTNDAQTWLAKGMAFDQSDKYEEAIECYDRIIQVYPDYVDAWYNRSVALEHLKRHDEARACLDKALQLDPNNAALWFSKGQFLNSWNNFKEAKACWNKANQLDPNYTTAGLEKGWYTKSLRASLDKLINVQERLESGAITKGEFEKQKHKILGIKGKDSPRAFCSNCGSQLAEGTKFCHNCGAAVGLALSKARPDSGILTPHLVPGEQLLFQSEKAEVRSFRGGLRSDSSLAHPRNIRVGTLAVTDRRIYVASSGGWQHVSRDADARREGMLIFHQPQGMRFGAIYDPQYARQRIETVRVRNAEIENQAKSVSWWSRGRFMTKQGYQSHLNLLTESKRISQESGKWLRLTIYRVELEGGKMRIRGGGWQLQIRRPLDLASGTIRGPSDLWLAPIIDDYKQKHTRGDDISYQPIIDLLGAKAEGMSRLVTELEAAARN